MIHSSDTLVCWPSFKVEHLRHDIESKMDNSDHNDGSNFAFDIDPVWMSPEPDPDECQTYDTSDKNTIDTCDANTC